jgi:DNA-packaging protein gp3
MARPTKYDDSFIDIANAYIGMCGREATELPTIEGLALRLGIDDEQVSIYAKQHPEFSATIKELMMKQKNQLINDGAYGGKDINSGMMIFLLKANHGMIETEKKILANDKDNPLGVVELPKLNDK